MIGQPNGVVYREVQRWSLRTRCLLLVSCLLGAVGGVVSTIMTFTQKADPWASLLVVVLCGVLLPIGIGFLIWVARLETEVRQDGLYIRYVPFHRHFKRFEARDLSQYHACTYRPILEYGGWGIRCGWRGRAYNVSGNRGVQLVFQNGRQVLIGSSKPSELEAAIRSIVHEN
jgi:hypothetical protein